MNYTYQCTNENCKHEFTLDQNLNGKHEATCPKCNSDCKRIFKANVNLGFKHSYNSTRK